MTTALTAYLTSAASSTLSTANKLYTTSGTPTIVENDTLIGTTSGWIELYAQGNASLQTGGGSIGSPSGHGFFLDTTVLEGQVFPASIWSGAIRSGLKSTDTCTVQFTVRAYRYHSGTYTQIVSMTTAVQNFTTSSAVNLSLGSATGTGGISFAVGDKLYCDVWCQITSAASLSTQKFRFDHLSTDTSGLTGDPLSEVVTPGYNVASTQVTKDWAIRGRVSQLTTGRDWSVRARIRQQIARDWAIRARIGTPPIQKDFAIRGRVSQSIARDWAIRARVSQSSIRDWAVRGRVAPLITKDWAIRGRIAATIARDWAIRARLSQITTGRDWAIRARLSQITTGRDWGIRARVSPPHLTSGGFTLYANGTGTAQYDSFRVTQYPDPSLSLAPVTPRTGATSILWNSITPTNTTLGMDTSTDGVNWTDVTSSNGGTLPGIFSQPDPVIDGFKVNSSANYTSTNRTGGSAATATFDTTNSRLALTGGTNALYLYTAITDNDIDFFVDMDQSDAGGMVWRFVNASNFYYLQIGDSLSSSTTNTATLAKVASNSRTQLATAPITYTVGSGLNQYTVNFTRGTYRRFRVTMLGGVITVYVDGVQLISYTDGSPLASGQMGLFNNGGTVGSRYYQLWMAQIGDYVSGTPSGDVVTGKFVYTRQRLATTDPSVSPQVLDLTTNAFTPMISPGVTIPSITYNASFLNSNFDDLAKQSNFSWYIDQNKNFIFRAGATVAAPWILQSSPAGLVTTVDLEVDTNLELDVSNDLYRNRQIILGATSTANFPETKTGDGSTRTFTLGYPLAAAPALTLNGVAKTNIGLKGTSGHDYYYALNDPVIVQDPSNIVLQNSDTLAIAYIGVTTVTVIVDNTTEQAARAAAEGQGTGIVEAVEDHTGENLTVAAATTLAQQLITRYAIAGRTLIFQTSRNGLAIGQTLTVFLPEHGIFDGQMLINQIEIFLQKGTQDTQTWWYKVTASELPKQDSWAKLVASGIGLQ